MIYCSNEQALLASCLQAAISSAKGLNAYISESGEMEAGNTNWN